MGTGAVIKEYILDKWVWVPRAPDEIFPFFSAPENLGDLTPPGLGFQILSRLPIEMRQGALVDYTIKLHGIPMRWKTEITRWDPPHSFEDTQLAGPYSKWVHTHTFVPERGGTTIEDRVVYALPFGPLGRLAHPLVSRQLEGIFSFRQKVLLKRFA